MDKVRARLKAQRRAERKRAEAERARRVLDNFNKHCRKHGLKNIWSPERIMRAQRQLETELEVGANIICVTAGAYVLNRVYGFGRKRLAVFAQEVYTRIENAYTGERTAYQFAEELNYEVGIDAKAYFTDESKPVIKGPMDYVERVNVLWRIIPVVLNIVLYSIYWRFDFKHKRMEAVCSEICSVIRDILEKNNIKYYIEEVKRHGLTITETGQFKIVSDK